ncbi:hypothetical protein ACI2K4_01140 [Micromonospora sp. NPDC050397]|uniref:hypothetical protein n=1 Tax=Micromonospora sp. NPDC050397 TaxID=3364279 RepID=UPI00384F2EE6
MITEPIGIDGVAGPIVVTTNAFWGRPAVTVGGVPAPRTGRHRYALPATAGGAVEATVRSAFADPYPTVQVNGVPHRTGPSAPVVLRVLTLLPLLLLAVGGALGGLVGALGLGANLAVARTRTPTVVKVLIMLGVSVVAYVLWLAIAVALAGAISAG